MSSDVWSPTRRSGLRALTLGALCLAVCLGLTAAPALASGPGVRIINEADGTQFERSGIDIAAAADVVSRPYTLRSSTSGGSTVRLTGLSIRGLLRLAGFDPDAVRFIAITRDDGSRATLRRADFADPGPFPEGPALVTDNGDETGFFRPIRGAGDTNARDNITSSDAGPLDINVEGGALLAVRARATPRRAEVGRTVRLRASIDFKPPGATFTYAWDFGDGSAGATGASVTHRYTREGSFPAQVTVEGRGGTGAVCQNFCGNGASVTVRVGDARASPKPATQQGSGDANLNGSGSGGSGSGGSGSGSGSTSGSSGAKQPGRQAPKQTGEPAPKAPTGPMVTGILLANSPTALKSSLPALSRAGGRSTASRAADEGAARGGNAGGSVLVTLVLVMVGALYERRRGTLRLA